MRCFVMVGVVVLLVGADSALAWGPATHIHLASQLLAQAGLVSAGVMALLLKNARHFLYGNIAADVVLGKRFSKVKHSCHRWSTALRLLDGARTSESQAFAYGYLTHLAADVVAHNKFVPRQLLMSRTTLNWGHVFWEMRADSHVRQSHWDGLQDLLHEPFPQHEALLQAHLADTLLSFETNLKIFNRMNLLACAQRWRNLMDHWDRASRWSLPSALLGQYHAESLALMRLVLHRADDPVLAAHDPSGTKALEQVRQDRRLLRRMWWQGLSGQWLAEHMAASYAPVPAPSTRQTSVA